MTLILRGKRNPDGGCFDAGTALRGKAKRLYDHAVGQYTTPDWTLASLCQTQITMEKQQEIVAGLTDVIKALNQDVAGLTTVVKDQQNRINHMENLLTMAGQWKEPK
jgi:hypothetical protein